MSKEKKEVVNNVNSKLWMRVCDITGEGMNEGYVLEDDTCIIKYEKKLNAYT